MALLLATQNHTLQNTALPSLTVYRLNWVLIVLTTARELIRKKIRTTQRVMAASSSPCSYTTVSLAQPLSLSRQSHLSLLTELLCSLSCAHTAGTRLDVNRPWAMNSFRQRPRRRMLRFQSLQLCRPEITWNSLGVTHFPRNSTQRPMLPRATRFSYNLAALPAQLTWK